METEDVQFSRVSLPTRLDNRVMDLRVSPKKSKLPRRDADRTFRHRPTRPSSESSPECASCSESTSTRKDSSRSTLPNSRARPPRAVRASSRSSTSTVSQLHLCRPGRADLRSQVKHSLRRVPSWPSRCALPVTWRECTRLLLVR